MKPRYPSIPETTVCWPWVAAIFAASSLFSAGCASADPVQNPASLAQGLADNNPLTRSKAAQALGALGPDARDVIPALMQAMEDEVGYVRMYAAEALTKMGDAGIAALASAVTHKDLYVRQQAVTTLNGLTPLPEQAVPALIAALRDANDLVTLEAASALTRSGYASAQAALAEFRTAEAEARQLATAQATRLYSREEASVSAAAVHAQSPKPPTQRQLRQQPPRSVRRQVEGKL